MTKSYFRGSNEKAKPTTDQTLVFRQQTGFGRTTRKVIVQVGAYYVVAPMNPASRRHRGRPCQILELNDSSKPDRAAVRFVDERGRWAIVDTADLAEPGTTAGPVAEPEVWPLTKVEHKASLLCARLTKQVTPGRMSEARTLLGKLGLLMRGASPAVSERCHELNRRLMAEMVEGVATASGRAPGEVAKEVEAELRKRVAH